MSADPPDDSPDGTPPASGEGAGDPPRRQPTAEEIEVPEDWRLEEEAPPPEAGEEERETRRPREAVAGRIARRAGGVMSWVDRLLLVIAVVVPVLILGYQSFEWLRSSQWPPIPVARVLVWVQADASAILAPGWPGVNRVLNWVLAAPLSLFLFVAGLLLHLLSGLLFPRAPRE